MSMKLVRSHQEKKQNVEGKLCKRLGSKGGPGK
jgi:hypothetical protein